MLPPDVVLAQEEDIGGDYGGRQRQHTAASVVEGLHRPKHDQSGQYVHHQERGDLIVQKPVQDGAAEPDDRLPKRVERSGGGHNVNALA